VNFPGPSELFLIAILALVVFGPKRLPEIARQVGKAVAEIRRVSRQFEREVRDATDPIVNEVRAAENEARKTFELEEDFSSFKAKPPQE
jgi:sec-independent protein translocase protein TatB